MQRLHPALSRVVGARAADAIVSFLEANEEWIFRGALAGAVIALGGFTLPTLLIALGVLALQAGVFGLLHFWAARSQAATPTRGEALTFSQFLRGEFWSHVGFGLLTGTLALGTLGIFALFGAPLGLLAFAVSVAPGFALHLANNVLYRINQDRLARGEAPLRFLGLGRMLQSLTGHMIVLQGPEMQQPVVIDRRELANLLEQVSLGSPEEERQARNQLKALLEQAETKEARHVLIEELLEIANKTTSLPFAGDGVLDLFTDFVSDLGFEGNEAWTAHVLSLASEPGSKVSDFVFRVTFDGFMGMAMESEESFQKFMETLVRFASPAFVDMLLNAEYGFRRPNVLNYHIVLAKNDAFTESLKRLFFQSAHSPSAQVFIMGLLSKDALFLRTILQDPSVNPHVRSITLGLAVAVEAIDQETFDRVSRDFDSTLVSPNNRLQTFHQVAVGSKTPVPVLVKSSSVALVAFLYRRFGLHDWQILREVMRVAVVRGGIIQGSKPYAQSNFQATNALLANMSIRDVLMILAHEYQHNVTRLRLHVERDSSTHP
jgi:hypothetical protein